ncbi:MAG: hypothetical protein ACRC1R_08235 [Cetobacterium sp.]|uniref:hypothetical protein n=1 Tax=Cetobacterium sp. TaxID=2071632 RepID=UPI003F41A2FA
MGEDIFEIIEILSSKEKIKKQYENIKNIRKDFENIISRIDKTPEDYLDFIKKYTDNKKISIIFRILFIKRFFDIFNGSSMEKLIEVTALSNLKTIITFAQLEFKFTEEEIILFCQLLRSENLSDMFKETWNEIAEENDELREELQLKNKKIKKLEQKLNFLKTDHLSHGNSGKIV